MGESRVRSDSRPSFGNLNLNQKRLNDFSPPGGERLFELLSCLEADHGLKSISLIFQP